MSGHSRALPLAARLATRDAARNRLRSSFAVAAVAVAVGLLAGCLTWLSSVQSAVQDAYRPARPRGPLVLARSTDQVQWGELGPEDLSAVASEFPDAQVALIGVGPTWDQRAGTRWPCAASAIPSPISGRWQMHWGSCRPRVGRRWPRVA